MTAAAAPSAQRVRIWDLPVRVTHWVVALLFAFQWWSGKAGRLEWHRWAGYAMIGCIVFRLLWGLMGSSTARFSSFVRGPGATVRYVRSLLRRPERGRFHVGHNPLGAWSILLMLALLVVQVSLGLYSVDTDGLESGPLASHVSFDTAQALAGWHARVFNVLLAVVAVHVLAAAFYLVVRRDNLIGPMLTGSRRGETGDAPLAPAGPARFAVAAAVGVGMAVWASKGFAPL